MRRRRGQVKAAAGARGAALMPLHHSEGERDCVFENPAPSVAEPA